MERRGTTREVSASEIAECNAYADNLESAKEPLVFGFVSPQIANNWFAWASIKGMGNEADADAFFETHVGTEDVSGLDWFCYDNPY